MVACWRRHVRRRTREGHGGGGGSSRGGCCQPEPRDKNAVCRSVTACSALAAGVCQRNGQASFPRDIRQFVRDGEAASELPRVSYAPRRSLGSGMNLFVRILSLSARVVPRLSAPAAPAQACV